LAASAVVTDDITLWAFGLRYRAVWQVGTNIMGELADLKEEEVHDLTAK
jgi:hypothetical protein